TENHTPRHGAIVEKKLHETEQMRTLTGNSSMLKATQRVTEAIAPIRLRDTDLHALSLNIQIIYELHQPSMEQMQKATI
ncbi:hypothetical protein HAX54_046303, partial [Datura stramonium]|nr:hypothetical protein [Datura stramonium]